MARSCEAAALALVALAPAALVSAPGCRFDSGGLADGDAGPSIVDAGDGGSGPDADLDGGGGLGTGDLRLWTATSGGLLARRLEAGRTVFGADGPATTLVGNPQFVVSAIAPAGDEELIGVQLESGGALELRLYARRGDAVTLEWSAALGPAGAGRYRAFDLAYERGSGDVLVVASFGESRPEARTRVGGVWSGFVALPVNDDVGPLPDLNYGTVRWVELEAGPKNDGVAVAWSDDNDTLAALVWTGAAFAGSSARTVTFFLEQNDAALRQDNRVFDLAWEEQSGNLLVAFGTQGENGIGWQRLSASTSSWSTTVIETSAMPAAPVDAVELEPRPGSNDIALAVLDMGGVTERLGVAMWTGGQWQDGVELDPLIADFQNLALGVMPGALGWEGAQAYCVYADDVSGGVGLATWTQASKWKKQGAIAAAGMGSPRSMVMVAAGARLVAVAADAAGALYAFDVGAAPAALLPAPLGIGPAVSQGVGFGLVARP